MRSRFKTIAVIGVVLALALAVTGLAAAPAAKQAPAVAQQAKKKQKKVKAGPIPPDFFGWCRCSRPAPATRRRCRLRESDRAAVRLLGVLEPQPGVYNWAPPTQ